MTPFSDSVEVLAAEQHRVEIYEAVSSAISHRSEVLQACYEARDSDEARAVIAQLLGVSDAAAQAVLDLQFRRLSEAERGAIDAQVQEMRERLRGR